MEFSGKMMYVCIYIYIWLVAKPTPLKNMSSSIGMINTNIWENNKYSKTQTSVHFIHLFMLRSSTEISWEKK